MDILFLVLTFIETALYFTSFFLKYRENTTYRSIFMDLFTNKIYWLIDIFIAIVFYSSKAFEDKLPLSMLKFIYLLAAYWIASFIYISIIGFALDLVIIVIKKIRRISLGIESTKYKRKYFSAFVIFSVIFLVSYGSINADNIRDINYKISIDKKVTNFKKMKIVFVTDIHMGYIIDDAKLRKVVNEINAKNPDLVLIGGDLIDNGTKAVKRGEMKDTLKEITSKYGVYACLGNHEYKSENINEVISTYENSNIHVLKDKYTLVDNSFYILGRDDYVVNKLGGPKRPNLAEILQGEDKTKPVIVLEHEPVSIKEAEENKIDLQLSGHTHNGQFFPGNIAEQLTYKLPYGYLKEDNSQFIVSSGIGTWGPPIRIGSVSEIVTIDLTFK